MRYRTAAILSAALVGGMFGMPAIVRAVFLPSLEQGPPKPIPAYERILLDVALFCGHWKFFLALPIVVVLFTIAEFTGQERVRRSQTYTAGLALKLPVGVTVIALLNIIGGFALFVSEVLRSVQQQAGGLAGMAVVVLLSIGLGVALLMRQNWSRWLVIVLYGLSLIGIPGRVIFAHGIADTSLELVPGLYLLWAVWYLCQSHVKAAFGTAAVRRASHKAKSAT